MFCKHCGQENPDSSSSCCNCGSPISMLFSPQVSQGGTAVAVAPAIEPGADQVADAAVQPPVEPQTDGKAVASLILGILGVLTVFLLIGIVLGIPAVILGHMSRSAIKKSMGKLKGAGMALAGLIMGYISLAGILVLPFILIIAAIAIPNLLKARMAANEATAVATVRTIDTAVMTYQTTNNVYPTDLKQLQDAGLIDPTLASGIKSGYRITYSASADRFFVVATPVKQDNTGVRNFCSAEDLIVRFTKGEECTTESSPLE